MWLCIFFFYSFLNISLLSSYKPADVLQHFIWKVETVNQIHNMCHCLTYHYLSRVCIGLWPEIDLCLYRRRPPPAPGHLCFKHVDDISMKPLEGRWHLSGGQNQHGHAVFTCKSKQRQSTNVQGVPAYPCGILNWNLKQWTPWGSTVPAKEVIMRDTWWKQDHNVQYI